MAHQLTQKHVDYNTELLLQASEDGDIEDVKRLIPVSDPKSEESYAVRMAARNGHTEVVALLISVSDPKANDSAALRWAAYNGYIECVKLLIPVSDPKTNNSLALQYAAKRKYTKIVQLLLPISDYLKAEQDMKNQYVDTAFLRQHIDEHEAFLQKERLTHQLNNSIDHTQHSSVKRKM